MRSLVNVEDHPTGLSPAAEAPRSAPPRLDSVDLVRGVVMVLMVLDHTRDFFSGNAFDPTDLERTTPALFLTRWVTHFCAPVFAFLAGTGAYLSGARGKSRDELAWFLVTRGLWLIFLEQTVVKFGLLFHPAPNAFFALVFWSIGWSLVVLAGLIYLPTVVVGAIGVLMIATHNLADGLRADSFGSLAPLFLILHQPGPIGRPPGLVLFIMYPLIPWVGVTAAGYAFGALLTEEPTRRRKTVLSLGAALTAAFFLLRALNVYGDPRPWSPQRSPLFTVLSFLNCQKYPPSLLFLLMTLGPAIMLLALVDNDRPAGIMRRSLVTLGRVPLFFYIAQWYVIHGLAVLVATARGVPAGWLFQPLPPGAVPPESAFGLPATYLAWAVVIALLYPLCHWFAGVKKRSRNRWLSYL